MTGERLKPVFVSHDIYRQAAYGSNHPLAIPRVELVMDLCGALGWLSPDEVCLSPRASEVQLTRFHTPEYVAALRQASESGRVDLATRQRFGIGTMENPLFPGVFERASTSVGGSIRAAELAREGRVAYHPAGGTHHGRPDRASGFCYFNDPVFALLTLLADGRERILYVDLDAHHGDAVQDAFAADARVWTISLHERGRWPHTGDTADVGGGHACNLAVPPRFNDAELRVLLHQVIVPLGRRISPQAVVVVCGADALAGDPLSSMALTNVALWTAVGEIVALAPAAVVLGGGGYNPWTVTRYWTGLWGALSGRWLPVALPVAAQQVLSGLHCDLIDDDEVLEGWLTTLADPPNADPPREAIAAMRDQALRQADAGGWSRMSGVTRRVARARHDGTLN